MEVIDGQQRLATITIFYSSLRNYFIENNDEDRAKEFEREYISETNRRTLEIIPKLTLSSNDADFFFNYITKRRGGNDESRINILRDSHERIVKAYKITDEFIKDKIKLNHGNLDYIHNLDDFIKEKVKIVIVKVPDDANAFTIFETLNDRGIALSQSDLIKNHLFNKAQDRIKEAQSNWSEMSGAIEAAQDEEEIINFIRYYWSSKYGLTRARDLFSEIKNKINNKNLAITFLTDLKSNSGKFLAILNPSHIFWNDFSDTTKEVVKTFIDLGLYQNRPLLLAVLNQFDKKEIEQAFGLILSWGIRNLITGSTPLGTLEREFSGLAKKINDGIIKNTKELFTYAKNLIPNDSEFKEKFAIATVSKNVIATYYLIKLEEYFSSSHELTPIRNFDRVNLEHILPQKYTKDLAKIWPYFNEEDHATYHKKIGNLTLLNTKINSNLKNISFDFKKEEYNKSRLEITKNINAYKNWNPESIKDRQYRFAEAALEIWKIKKD